MSFGKAISALALSSLLAAAGSGCAGGPRVRPEPAAAAEPAGADEPSAAERLGIEPLALRRLAYGNLLDFRYRVVDPERARRLFETDLKPVLVERDSGLRLTVPRPAKVGPLKSYGAMEAGRIHFILFANPGRRVEPGARVVLVLGEQRIEGLVVE